jgi:hypothetical protein
MLASGKEITGTWSKSDGQFGTFVATRITGATVIGSDSEWKFSRSIDPGWEQPGYDDSAWGNTVGDSAGACGSYPGVMWAPNPVSGETIVVRRTIDLVSAPTQAIYVGGFDDDGLVYVNGTLVHTDDDNWSTGMRTFDITSLLHSGSNVLAMRASDDVGGCQGIYARFAIAAAVPTDFAPLAEHWAPVVYQDTDSSNPRADYLTRFDFDGDFRGRNNWNNLTSGDLRGYAYYWVVETSSHWFIGYGFYHPRDWGEAGLASPCTTATCHENDMEGALLTVQKDETEYGNLIYMNTRAHFGFESYQTSSIHLLGWRPEVYVDAKAHAVTGDKDWEQAFPGGDGIGYVPTGIAEEPASGDEDAVGYALLNLQELWAQRCSWGDEEPFFSYGTFRGDDYGNNSANAPWGWGDSFFRDPIAWVGAAFNVQGLLGDYVDASVDPRPFDQDADCVPLTAGNGVTVTFEQMTGTGSTTASPSGTGPATPQGFQPGTSPRYFDLTTTVSYTGRIEVCADYDPTAFQNEEGLRMFHYENGAWSDVTAHVDTSTHRLCGFVLNLSPFHIAELIPDQDYDLDGCTNAQEVGTNPSSGGGRDPQNPWDYFNPTHDGQNRIDDILRTVEQYFEDEFLPSPPNAPNTPNPNYTQDTDRTRIGPDPLDLGPPNGQQRVDDILNAVEQYFHDCA